MVACSDNEDSNLVPDSLLIENGARVCGEYAFDYDNEFSPMGGSYIVYKAKDYNMYERINDLGFGVNFIQAGVMDTGNIFLFTDSEVIAWSIEQQAMVNSHSYPYYYELYGLVEDNLYYSYKNFDGDKIYAKLDTDLENEVTISKQDIPKKFDYYRCF